jgi:hypothetical protein
LSPRRRGSEELGRLVVRPPDERRGNDLFYMSAEGERTEYDYFGRIYGKYGRSNRFVLQMPTQRHGLEPSGVVAVAGRHVDDPDIKEVWALFDHDGRTNIDQVCAQAARQNIRTALSHPSFELWLLLHFQDFSPAAQNGQNGVIIDKLRRANSAFADYGKDNKGIDARRFEALCENDGIQNAVRRARVLLRNIPESAPSSRDPSTDVHHLIESLGIVPRP